jgi:DNA-binding NarL/FixJ family response regulator
MKSCHTSVYLVEDSPIILKLLTELIEATGGSVVGHADSANAAIAEIGALHPDAVTIDISLKRGNGFDVLEAIAINHEGEPPLRIVLTNYATDAYRLAAQNLGADHFFDKAKQVREVLMVLSSLNSANSGSDHSSALAA